MGGPAFNIVFPGLVGVLIWGGRALIPLRG
jgi:hypothetical protein